MSRRRLLELAGLAGAALRGPVWVMKVEPRWVDWVRQDAVMPKLPRRLDGLRILHLSDIQYGRHHVDKDKRPPLYPDYGLINLTVGK